MDLNWFQLGPAPADQIIGTYNYGLVTLSYVIAVLASYVALDLAARLRAETSPQVQMYWLLGGSFAMGAGIWSMHFIGMLAFIMPMPMNYALSWTASSLIAAILASCLALYLLKNKDRPVFFMMIGGVFMGLGIATMHYMGMTGMTGHVIIHYLPGLFFLSILIAIIASEAALWLALQSSYGSIRRQFYYKLLSALIMGAAICGMHYTGMAAAIFTPIPGHPLTDMTGLDPYLLAYAIAIITVLIIGLALTVSIYYRQMVSAIRNEKEFLNAVLNNMNDGIIAVDPAGIVTVCNEGINRYVKITKGVSYLDLHQFFQLRYPHTDIQVKIEKNPLYLALKGEFVNSQEYYLYYDNHDLPRNVIIHAQPIIGNDGETRGALIIIHDITNLKQTEKLKQEFVSIVSHELRTPLTSIRGSLSLLLANVAGELPEKMRNLLEIADNNTGRLIRLINDILDIEKIEAGKMDFHMKEVDIIDVIRNAINDVKATADRGGVAIVFDYFGEEIVHGDYDKLMQVVLNLLANAIRFSARGQKVIVKVLPSDTSTRISVIDEGPGIPAEFRNRIFNKFSQADSSSARKKGGTGLGLSICKAIIEKHGGSINYESIPNQMTCFYFDLPKETIQASKKQAPIPIEQAAPAEATILICDSNPDSAAMLQKFLGKHHIVADITLTASEARKKLKEKHYAVLAMDLVLQDYDGIKFIRELRQDKLTAQMPIIVVSTQINDAKKELNGAAFPVIDWLEKPLEPQQLAKLLRYIRSEFHTELPKVLCVEDDPDITQIIKELLSSEADVTTAFTVAAARKKLKTEPFDLIVLDLKLPDGMGTDLLPSINCMTKKIIPVIVFSAYELDHKYAHLVKQSLLKSRVSNEQLLNTLESVLMGF